MGCDIGIKGEGCPSTPDCPETMICLPWHGRTSPLEIHVMSCRTPHASNAPGDFYVEDSCCTSCAMPFTEAPGHFAYDESGHCFVSRQPSSLEETERMVFAIQVADLGCIRYAGDDSATLARLVELGEGRQCDRLDEQPKPVEPKSRVWWARWLKP